MGLHTQRLLAKDFEGFVLRSEPLAKHTSYRIGGPADLFIQADSLSALKMATDYCREQGIPWIAVGRGTNLLVADEGFRGAVIKLGTGFASCVFNQDSETFTVGASCRLSQLVREACALGRSGFEFVVGTPGSVGGALRMNAGTSHEYLGSRVISVTTLRPGFGLKRYAACDIVWGYREASLPFDEIILECELASSKGEPADIRARMDAALSRRRKTQPLAFPSCGSVFRNPERESVGRLIENVGLKGAWCGGAQISELHANFIVNRDGAKAVEVLTLMHAVQDAVKERYDIDLVPEVRFLGFA